MTFRHHNNIPDLNLFYLQRQNEPALRKTFSLPPMTGTEFPISVLGNSQQIMSLSLWIHVPAP